jgi:hypothetical protein
MTVLSFGEARARHAVRNTVQAFAARRRLPLPTVCGLGDLAEKAYRRGESAAWSIHLGILAAKAACRQPEDVA